MRHAVEDQPFRRGDLRFWHFSAVFRDGQDTVDQADSGQLAGPGPIAQLLQFEIQLLLFLGDPGIGLARDAEPQIGRLLACLKGRARHQLRFQRAEGPAALDPDVARAQAVAQHGEGGDFTEAPVPLVVGSNQFADLLLEMADRHLAGNARRPFRLSCRKSSIAVRRGSRARVDRKVKASSSAGA